MAELDIDAFIGRESGGELHSDFNDDDTYALRNLKTAAQKRLLWKYIVELGIPDTEEQKRLIYLFYIGRQSVSNVNIFKCRERLQPAKWYYKVGEKLPEPVRFTPKFTADELMSRQSVGHQRLAEMDRQWSRRGLADRYGLDYDQIANTLNTRWNPIHEKRTFRSLPQAQLVLALRDVISPDLWYVFPEELDDSL